uniref:GST N-terminal domain-containing protein n=1 Tax=Medicago truncatula TaxID=3880 RepID=B7FIE5_MEDTR|nr:unknown [Medicago truncatula]
MATTVKEIRTPPLTSNSDPPPIFNGDTRLYISYVCPYAQRAWIARNYKGLQDKIKLVSINLQDRPAWYKEKVYPENKVPSLEHNGKVLGESLDLISYIDVNFEGLSLVPSDPAKKEFGDQLISHVDTFTKDLYSSLKGDPIKQAGPAFDYLENALGKFDDGPFFLGQFSWVDIAYVPFVERFHIVFSEVFKHDITEGRPKLAAWD